MTAAPLSRAVRPQEPGEELLNALTHGAGALLAVLATCFLLHRAAVLGGVVNRVSVAVFGVSMVVLYLFSCLYHALPRGRGKQVLQVFDHCSIFLLILGTYTPICLVTIGGRWGVVLFSVLAVCAVVGIVLNCVSLTRFKRLSQVLYLIMGWMGLLTLPMILRALPLWGFLFLLFGGLAYTAGVFFYRHKEKRYWHGIWHFFVLAGTAFHFVTIFTNCCF